VAVYLKIKTQPYRLGIKNSPPIRVRVISFLRNRQVSWLRFIASAFMPSQVGYPVALIKRLAHLHSGGTTPDSHRLPF
jgi:hypothetical protein